MERNPVASSNIRSVGYQDGTLEVEFVTGNVYQYFDVPQQVYQQLLSAPSPGTYFHEMIRGYYRYARA